MYNGLRKRIASSHYASVGLGVAACRYAAMSHHLHAVNKILIKGKSSWNLVRGGIDAIDAGSNFMNVCPGRCICDGHDTLQTPGIKRRVCGVPPGSSNWQSLSCASMRAWYGHSLVNESDKLDAVQRMAMNDRAFRRFTCLCRFYLEGLEMELKTVLLPFKNWTSTAGATLAACRT